MHIVRKICQLFTKKMRGGRLDYGEDHDDVDANADDDDDDDDGDGAGTMREVFQVGGMGQLCKLHCVCHPTFSLAGL